MHHRHKRKSLHAFLVILLCAFATNALVQHPYVTAERGAMQYNTHEGAPHEQLSDIRQPWLWESRIGGGVPNKLSVRDVGGYVYISTPKFRCNGALIDPEWVLTSAGCVVEASGARPQISASNIKVVPGCYDGSNCLNIRNPLWYGTRAEVYTVQQVVISPSPTVSDADLTVALLKLSQPVVTGNGTSIVPIGTNTDPVIGQSGLFVMSYGDIPPSVGPTSLQRAPYSITADSSCINLNGFQSAIHHCGDRTPRVCKSDIGAPVMRMLSGGQTILHGILSSQYAVYGVSCPQNERSVAIDVTSAPIRNWIAAQIASGRSGLVRNADGSGGLGVALPRSDNKQHVVDVRSIFPQGIQIGSVRGTSLSINENGVIALGSVTNGIPEFINLSSWSGNKSPIIMVFGADGDTSGTTQRVPIGGNSTGSNQVWVATNVAQRTLTVTWDDIRPFSTNITGLRHIGNSYQVELRAQSNGDIKITMRYGVIGWTVGARQCESTCSGRFAQVGIADGQGKFELGNRVSATSDTELRQLTGKQLTFYLRNGVIYKVNQTPPVRRAHNPIFIWTGRSDAIPAGWERVTVLDGKFPRVVANRDQVLATGGSPTHTHTSPPHSHTMANHTHVTSYGGSVNQSTTGTRDGGIGSANGHAHESVTTSNPVNVSVSAESVTYSAFSNNPPYYEVIFIMKTDGEVNEVPPGVVVLSKNTLGALTLANGRNGTPNLQNTFLRGAPTGSHAGGVGGNSKNTHTIDHTHSTVHDHDDQWAGRDTTTNTTRADESGKSDNTLTSHSHITYYNPANENTAATSAISTAETVLPPYTDFVVGQNKTGRDVTQTGILALYTGSATDLPKGWVLYSKIGTLIRGSNKTGTRGGSATHTHGPSVHTHPDIPHTHSGITSEASGTNDNNDGSRTSLRRHYHDISVSIASVQLSSAVTTANAASNMPEYVNVYLIEYVGR